MNRFIAASIITLCLVGVAWATWSGHVYYQGNPVKAASVITSPQEEGQPVGTNASGYYYLHEFHGGMVHGKRYNYIKAYKKIGTMKEGYRWMNQEYDRYESLDHLDIILNDPNK